MARSTYIYVAAWFDPAVESGPLVAATVKREFLDALERFEHPDGGLSDLECWRLPDGGSSGYGPTRTYLGTAADYLAKERPGG